MVSQQAGSPWGAFGWLGSSPEATDPPYGADPEYDSGAQDVLESLMNDKWLFPPNLTDGEGDIAPAPPHPSSSTRAPAPGTDPDLPPADPDCVEDILRSYHFEKVRNVESQKLVAILLTPSWKQAPPQPARAFAKCLKEFADKAFIALTKVTSEGLPLIPAGDRDEVVDEGCLAMRFMVQQGRLHVTSDLLLCLEAFELSRGKTEETANWLSMCLCMLIKAALDESSPTVTQQWQESMKSRINSEGRELYGQIDVRAWPHILHVVGADHGDLDGSACKTQISMQLCMVSDLKDWREGLRQASELINRLALTEEFTPEEIYSIFNDKDHFQRRLRHDFLYSVLKDAPRQFVQDVLTYMDENDTDIGERADEEIYLVMDLITSLNEDIRCCRHASFQMKSQWLVGQFNHGRRGSDGIVSREEMSPEQICDHIEDFENHEDLLKIAVKELIRSERKFEAARMLARPKSRVCQVFEANRNDKQIAYLVSLYQDIEPLVDRFGPVEDDCLALPSTREALVYVDNIGPAMDTLERDTIAHQRPMTLGIWWCWRCFNDDLDKMVRASFVALCYEDTFVIVDIDRLERVSTVVERKGKELMRNILLAPHILKVAHDVNRSSLSILQRSLIANSLISSTRNPSLPGISPILDLSVAAAFVKQMQPSAPAVSKLLKLTNDYLRLEMCMAEALSNFERRPLRLTQLHYALTLAWCPLMILRVLTAHGILDVPDLLHMTFQLGGDGAPADWDEVLHSTWLCSPQNQAAQEVCAALDPQLVLPGPYGQNPWEDEAWVEAVPRPEERFCLRSAFSAHDEYLAPLRLPAEIVQQVEQSLHALVTEPMDEDFQSANTSQSNSASGYSVEQGQGQHSTSQKLAALYAAYRQAATGLGGS